MGRPSAADGLAGPACDHDHHDNRKQQEQPRREGASGQSADCRELAAVVGRPRPDRRRGGVVLGGVRVVTGLVVRTVIDRLLWRLGFVGRAGVARVGRVAVVPIVGRRVDVITAIVLVGGLLTVVDAGTTFISTGVAAITTCPIARVTISSVSISGVSIVATSGASVVRVLIITTAGVSISGVSITGVFISSVLVIATPGLPSSGVPLIATPGVSISGVSTSPSPSDSSEP